MRGQATGSDRLIVRIGLWTGSDGRVRRARWQATTCATLVAYTELACELMKDGADPAHLDAIALQSALAGVHPRRRERAALVARAIANALHAEPEGEKP